MRFVVIYITCILLFSKAFALDCRKDKFENIKLTICKTSVFTDDLRLYLQNKHGVPYGNFNALQQDLNDNGKELLFAMNGGMYHPDLGPVGHYKEEFSEKKNCHLRPRPRELRNVT
jgi:uncharacterized protein YigE (DUF2233 family)